MRDALPFTKMHGCGNDYVVVDGTREDLGDLEALARAMCDRRFGVGSDGLLVAAPSGTADIRMRMFNVDGSEAEMCGNGIRCFAKYVVERSLVAAGDALDVETGNGVLHIELLREGDRVTGATVDMGVPRLERRRVPMTGEGERAVDEPLEVGDRTLLITAVSMGNPHAVTWVDDVDAYPVETVGPRVERHPAFPQRTNTEFVEVVSPSEVRQRTWERGCGETHACGTGACAVVVAGATTGRTGRDVLVRLRGGDLRMRWDDDDHVRMTGPAVEVYEGRWPRAALPVS